MWRNENDILSLITQFTDETRTDLQMHLRQIKILFYLKL